MPISLMLWITVSIAAACNYEPDLQALALSVQHALLHRLRPGIRPGALLLRALMRRLRTALKAQACVAQSQTHHLQHPQAHLKGRDAREPVMHMQLRMGLKLNTH